MNDAPDHPDILQRRAPLWFAGAAALLAVCAWEGPLSGGYLLRAFVVGLINGSLVVSFRRWEPKRLDRPLRALLIASLVAGGFFWSKDQTFGHDHAGVPFWPLAGQFLAGVAAVSLAALWAAGRKPKDVRRRRPI